MYLIMILLVAFAFLAGIVTVLSPCILPVLPIVLAGSTGGKQKPIGVVVGFVLSFTFFTLFLASIVQATGISAETVRYIAVVIIFAFGVSLLVPQMQLVLEQAFTFFSRFSPKGEHKGFGGGILIGMSLGLVWTPCVGPILASVISLAITGTVTGAAALITLAYATGTAIPMLAITYGGRQLLHKVPWLLNNTATIQKVFGVLMIVVAIGLIFKVERSFQQYILEVFPQYGQGLTTIEDNDAVQEELDKLKDTQQSQPESRMDNSQELSGIDAPVMDTHQQEDNYPDAPDIISGGEWFNLPEGEDTLSLEALEGDVVLVHFWTLGCINCIRTLPHVKALHETYADEGFTVIGVHTPEFAFEKEATAVRNAIVEHDLPYPVVQDNGFETWRAYNNRYWPAIYLVDNQGRIRYTHFGEGKYEETEAMVERLISETQ